MDRKKIHRYWYFLVLSPPIASVGAGLLFTIGPNTPNSHVIGYQILLGIGTGGALQNTIIAIQTGEYWVFRFGSNRKLTRFFLEYAKEENLIPQGTSLVNFVQIVGGVIGITVGAGTSYIQQLIRLTHPSIAIFGNQLATNIIKFAPGLTPEQVIAVRSSVTAIFQLPKELQAQAIQAYSESLDRVFLIAVPAGALASIAGMFVKNYNIQKRSPTGGISGGMA